MCNKAAKIFKMSQISWSVNIKTFIADLKKKTDKKCYYIIILKMDVGNFLQEISLIDNLLDSHFFILYSFKIKEDSVVLVSFKWWFHVRIYYVKANE